MKFKLLPRLFLLALAMAAWPAIGETAQPTSAQRTAIRNACQSDFMKYCSTVKPGGADALACLEKNVADLSAACQTAVGAVSRNTGGTSSPPNNGSGAASTAVAKTPAPTAIEPGQKVV